MLFSWACWVVGFCWASPGFLPVACAAWVLVRRAFARQPPASPGLSASSFALRFSVGACFFVFAAFLCLFFRSSDDSVVGKVSFGALLAVLSPFCASVPSLRVFVSLFLVSLLLSCLLPPPPPFFSLSLLLFFAYSSRNRASFVQICSYVLY